LCAADLAESGEFIGFIGLAVPAFEAAFTPCVEIGWRLAAEY
jgi:ribosomal-protein-alanine N-acetyltransferase